MSQNCPSIGISFTVKDNNLCYILFFINRTVGLLNGRLYTPNYFRTLCNLNNWAH